MVHYTCQRVMLPTVEAALAANGYVVEHPLMWEVNGDRMVVMTHLSAVVLLAEREQSEIADIEVYGVAHTFATMLLEQLPICLAKQSAPGNISHQ